MLEHRPRRHTDAHDCVKPTVLDRMIGVEDVATTGPPYILEF